MVQAPQDQQDQSDPLEEMDQLVYEELKEHVVPPVPQDPLANPDQLEMLVLLAYPEREVPMVLMG